MYSRLFHIGTRQRLGCDDEARRRCVGLLDMIENANPDSRRDLCAAVATFRGRRLRLVPIRMGANAACGIWIAAAGGDYIFYEDGTTPAHQRHIVFHELGHVLFNHCGSAVDPSALVGALTHLDPAVVGRVLARTSFDDEEERQAELFACLAGERMAGEDLGLSAGELSPADLDPDISVRLGSVFESPRMDGERERTHQ